MFVPREVVNDREEGRYEREERKLDVSDPQVRLRSLQHHLEIDASKPGGAASDQDSKEPGSRIHEMGCSLPASAAHALHLDDPDAHGQEKERNPLAQAERLVKEENRESGGSEDLDLIRNLERCSIEVLRSNILQVVLDN